MRHDVWSTREGRTYGGECQGLCLDRCGAAGGAGGPNLSVCVKGGRPCGPRALLLAEKQQAEENRCLCTIEKIQISGGGGAKNNMDTLSTAHLKGVQSSDSECLEQPFLMSFVQAGNINSSQH